MVERPQKSTNLSPQRTSCETITNYFFIQLFLCFLPPPHGQRSFLPILGSVQTLWQYSLVCVSSSKTHSSLGGGVEPLTQFRHLLHPQEHHSQHSHVYTLHESYQESQLPLDLQGSLSKNSFRSGHFERNFSIDLLIFSIYCSRVSKHLLPIF